MFFVGCCWFKFNNLVLALGMALIKTKRKKFLGAIPTYVEIKGEKLVGKRGTFFPNPEKG